MSGKLHTHRMPEGGIQRKGCAYAFFVTVAIA